MWNSTLGFLIMWNSTSGFLLLYVGLVFLDVNLSGSRLFFENLFDFSIGTLKPYFSPLFLMLRLVCVIGEIHI